MSSRQPSRVEQFAAIRRDARAGMSGRELQRHHGVGWRTVQAALADLFDDDLDGVAGSLDVAIKSAADALQTKSAQ
ncbi:hypothetical protein [Mycobacterium sp. Aquia_213]|uniref:hypothetical protein n=1 Tax=Mycobacterium sp. Aquia_213 TaxID=2991728 RepID=UPI00226FB859|nr:hypothetical protein [Mycobacterium sp. Aquia_213]WAC91130.1 hypothetical protein LMQ14_25190 [Mycobacterium sp. Aquia_213]